MDIARVVQIALLAQACGGDGRDGKWANKRCRMAARRGHNVSRMRSSVIGVWLSCVSLLGSEVFSRD